MRSRTLTPLVLALAVLAAACSSGGSTAATTTTKPPAVHLVALGDSFSSGEGAPPYDPASNSCHRAAAGWAQRLDRDAPAVASLDHRACSGATTANLTGPWTSRGLGPQIPSTPDPRITLVTLTIGGNDIGFSNIVATCFIVSCAGVPSDGGFLGAIHALTTTLDTSVYPALERAYPNARIAHVGYPRLTPAKGRPLTDCPWLDPAEQVATAQIVAELDKAILAARAGHPRVTYVDTTDALAGHELCTATSWVHAVAIGGQSQAHPTADGQRALERSIARSLHLPLR